MKNKPLNTTPIHKHTHRRLFSYAVGVPAFLATSAALSLLLTIVVLVQMFSLSMIIAEVFTSNMLPSPLLFVVFGACIIIRSLLTWLRERNARKKSVVIKSKIRQEAFKTILALGPLYARSEKTGGLINLLTEGTEKLEDYFTHYIPSLLHIAILPPVIILFVFFLDWPSALILLITGPLIVFFMWLIGTYAKKISQEQWKSLSGLSASFLDAIQGLKTLKMFGVSEQESENIANSSNSFREITMRVLKVAFMSGMVLELAASISIALVAVQVGIRLIEGMMSFQPGLFMLLLAPEFYLPFRALGQHHHAGMEGSAAASELFNVIDQPDVSASAGKKSQQYITNPKNITHVEFSKNLEIKLHQLQYTYPQQNEAAIAGLSCSLPSGQLTAIVGPSSSGKTTFVHLLMGYIRPASGSILINGISLEDIDPELWRQHIAFVSQHPHFFNGSILENLHMARNDASMEEIRHMAAKARADEFISKMPNSYDTPLRDNASRLSGGERQRLALARALLRNAPLLILDEPTSSLDPESEEIVTRATLNAARNRTTLVIAHRLKTVRNADNILVFNKGKIVESGNHSELIQKKGMYFDYLRHLGF